MSMCKTVVEYPTAREKTVVQLDQALCQSQRPLYSTHREPQHEDCASSRLVSYPVRNMHNRFSLSSVASLLTFTFPLPTSLPIVRGNPQRALPSSRRFEEGRGRRPQ